MAHKGQVLEGSNPPGRLLLPSQLRYVCREAVGDWVIPSYKLATLPGYLGLQKIAGADHRAGHDVATLKQVLDHVLRKAWGTTDLSQVSGCIMLHHAGILTLHLQLLCYVFVCCHVLVLCHLLDAHS
jgi:DNA polymerase III epsilon subunit-like protein